MILIGSQAGAVAGPLDPEPAARRTEMVPAYAASPADHDAALDEFVAEHDDWEKRRIWPDDATHLIHESQTLRAELVHETDPRGTAWTFAAYETPVSGRMWRLTLTGAAPAPVLKSLRTAVLVPYPSSPACTSRVRP
ncbi:DUF317 domain-containing protein [Streptomyces sp. NPDC085927]|uniref:DUF317 domain-containing protein n=1 Tax=Streptomyces sp. NPDC085927 TaxID=3365738 RepID=UPI0037D4FEF3